MALILTREQSQEHANHQAASTHLRRHCQEVTGTRRKAPDKQQRSLGTPGEHKQSTAMGLDACTCYVCGKDCFSVPLTKTGVLETYHQLSPVVTSRHCYRGSLSLPMFHRHHSTAFPSPASGKPSFPQAECCGQNSPTDFPFIYLLSTIPPPQVLQPPKIPFLPLPHIQVPPSP